MRPAITARVSEIYLGEAAGKRCPGEDDCQIFQSSAFVDDLADDGEPWGKRHVCAPCDLRHSKPPKLVQIDGGQFDQAELAEIVDRVESLAAEQQAGFGFQLHELTPLEWELLIFWRSCEESIKRQWQSRLVSALESVCYR